MQCVYCDKEYPISKLCLCVSCFNDVGEEMHNMKLQNSNLKSQIEELKKVVDEAKRIVWIIGENRKEYLMPLQISIERYEQKAKEHKWE